MAQTTRAAWLVLGSKTLTLDNPDAGWFCQELDLGFPDVRDVTDPNPVAHGLIDRTQFFGGRVVSATMMAIPGILPLDTVVEQFAPFLDVDARPELHFTTQGNTVERVLILRASAWSAPMGLLPSRPFQMSWVAADPIAVSASTAQAIAWAGTDPSLGLGRRYDLRFNRTYTYGGSVATAAYIVPKGDLPVMPYLRIYGPIENPVVTLVAHTGTSPDVTSLISLTMRIDGGQFVGIDTAKHAAYFNDDPSQSVQQYLNWSTLVWPVLPVLPGSTLMTLSGELESTSHVTQVVATWRERYL